MSMGTKHIQGTGHCSMAVREVSLLGCQCRLWLVVRAMAPVLDAGRASEDDKDEIENKAEDQQTEIVGDSKAAEDVGRIG